MTFTMPRLLAIRWSVEEFFRKHASGYDQPLEISHLEAISRIKVVLEPPMGTTLKLESEKVAAAGNTLKVFAKHGDRLRGIGPEDKRRDMNQGLIWSSLMGCIENPVKNRKMMERFSSATFSWPI